MAEGARAVRMQGGEPGVCLDTAASVRRGLVPEQQAAEAGEKPAGARCHTRTPCEATPADVATAACEKSECMLCDIILSEDNNV